MKNRGEGKACRQSVGAAGEAMAIKFFQQQGLEILHTNWRNGHQEIDIIATDGRKLLIIEVKTQTSDIGGMPEENVNRKKLLNLMKAADAFMQQDQRWTLVQFDILSILLRNGKPEYLWIEDVYI